MPDVTLNGVPQKLYRYDVDDTPVNAAVDVPPSSNWAFDHAADLDAHTYDIRQKLRTGQYFPPAPSFQDVPLALVANEILAIPFIVARALTVDRLAIHVTIAAAGGAIARLGIYEDGANLYPGDLVLDAGTVAVDGAAVVAATINQALTKGLYWLAIVSDNTPTVNCFYQSYPILGLVAATFGIENNQSVCWGQAAVGSGALADPFVGAAAIRTTATHVAPVVAYRIASLD